MILKTERLLIRKLIAEDWKMLKAIALDFRQSDYIIYDMPLLVEDNEIRKLAEVFADSHLFFAVFLQDSPEMIGYVCFHRENEGFDLGYCFASAHHKNGYAFEACSALMSYLEQTFNIHSFTAGTALKNIPSCKLLSKLGFILTGTEALSFHKDADGNDITFEGGNFIKK